MGLLAEWAAVGVASLTDRPAAAQMRSAPLIRPVASPSPFPFPFPARPSVAMLHSEHKSRELEGTRIQRWTLHSQPKVRRMDRTQTDGGRGRGGGETDQRANHCCRVIRRWPLHFMPSHE